MQFKFELPKQEQLLPLKGLQGPFKFNQRIVYFDPLNNQYWDPASDHYLTDEETYQLISFVNGKLRVQHL
jgi:hypothetical protein